MATNKWSLPFWTHGRTLNMVTLLPLGNRLGVDAVLFCQASYARLTTLDCSTHCLCRGGATVLLVP
jgi:hypothetical protein